MLRYNKVGLWELANKTAENANQDGTITFGQLAEKYGVRIKDICFAVSRHWPWGNIFTRLSLRIKGFSHVKFK